MGYRIGAAAIAVYALVLYGTGGLGWQHVSLPFMIWACLSRREGPRRFMGEWAPMILFWLSYDSMRIWGVRLFHRVEVEQPFRWEAAMFLSPDGSIWPFYFARRMSHSGTGWVGRALEGYSTMIYLSYLFAVPCIMLVLWIRKRMTLFRRMLWTFTILNFSGLVLYVLYPAAPPWWVYENGFALPTLENSRPAGFSDSKTLSTLFQYSANRFGAIPSLHAAHPLLLVLVLARHGVRARWISLAAFYALSMWFATVFLNQHYIIDLLIGAALIPLAMLGDRIAERRTPGFHSAGTTNPVT